MTPATTAPATMPRQVPFIIANEACERFSFYGMRNILTVFLISSLLLYLPEGDRAGEAKDIFHSFVIGVYFFPLLGGWIADRFWGKYQTVIWFSLVYCAGHACLAVFEDSRQGFFFGLFLIAFGSGGIKPLVVSFVGDQFDQSNKHLAKIVFDAFYWIINFGSFFASLLMPFFLKTYGAAVAFGIPGLLMLIATLVFWLGRKRYINIPPAPADPDSFLRVTWTALVAKTVGQGRPGLILAVVGALLALFSLTMIPKLGFVLAVCLALLSLMLFGGIGAWRQLDRARGAHGEAAVDSVRAVLRILIVFALTTPFWSLFDQKASTWVLQGKEMLIPSGQWWWPSFVSEASQMQALNPMLILLLIPFNNLVLYPALRHIGIETTALRRMGFGIFFSGLAWIAAGAIQLMMDTGAPTSLAWQILPYALLTFGEVLVSATGLEFAYSQAPKAMKGTIMSFWYLAVTMGNVWVLVVNAGVRHESVNAAIENTGFSVASFQMFFFAAFAFAATLAFAWYAKRYPVVDNYRAA